MSHKSFATIGKIIDGTKQFEPVLFVSSKTVDGTSLHDNTKDTTSTNTFVDLLYHAGGAQQQAEPVEDGQPAGKHTTELAAQELNLRSRGS